MRENFKFLFWGIEIWWTMKELWFKGGKVKHESQVELKEKIPISKDNLQKILSSFTLCYFDCLVTGELAIWKCPHFHHNMVLKNIYVITALP